LLHLDLIPRNRLQNIPPDLRVKHEYCFFLHDQCVQILKEYEEAKANHVTVNFESEITAAKFQELSNSEDPIDALSKTGHPEEAKKVILNGITMGLVSDCLHHLFEGLKCFEKRKFIVAFNILRKPLKDNLLYLSWLLSDKDLFYSDFMTGDPEKLTQRKLGNTRIDIFSKAIKKAKVDSIVEAEILEEFIFDRKSDRSLEGYFQHAVHLVTSQNLELRTSPKNFNFIFKNPLDEDIYYLAYDVLPYVLLYLSNVIISLYDKIKKMDQGTKKAFHDRTGCGYLLIEKTNVQEIIEALEKGMIKKPECNTCQSQLKITYYNALRITLNDSFRCNSCRHINWVPFSWEFW
jgi:hypothetical protein